LVPTSFVCDSFFFPFLDPRRQLSGRSCHRKVLSEESLEL
jgi:hypothetical protein